MAYRTLLLVSLLLILFVRCATVGTATTERDAVTMARNSFIADSVRFGGTAQAHDLDFSTGHFQGVGSSIRISGTVSLDSTLSVYSMLASEFGVAYAILDKASLRFTAGTFWYDVAGIAKFDTSRVLQVTLAPEEIPIKSGALAGKTLHYGVTRFPSGNFGACAVFSIDQFAEATVSQVFEELRILEPSVIVIPSSRYPERSVIVLCEPQEPKPTHRYIWSIQTLHK